MKFWSTFTILIVMTFSLVAFEPHFMKHPAISPDGETICFRYLDDLWLVPFSGGEAKRITDSEGTNWNPVFSPDGKNIAFNSNRNGWTAIYLLPAEGGEAKPISKENFYLNDWFPKRKELLVRRGDPHFRNRFFRLKLDGEFNEITPFGGNDATISNRGNTILFDRRGLRYREAYQGSFNGDLWLYEIDDDKFSRLTKTDLTENYPTFSQNPDQIFFAASDGNVFQLCRAKIDELPKKQFLTNFKTWSVRDISCAKNTDRIVFEKFDELWTWDSATQKAEKLQIEIKQDILDDHITLENVHNKADKFRISQDGKLIVFSYKFDLFAFPEKGDKVLQITKNQLGINDIVILGDDRTIAFSSFVDGTPQLFRVDIRNVENIEKLEWSEDKYIEFMNFSNGHLFINYSEDDKYHKLAMADSMGNEIKPLITEKYVWSSLQLSPQKKYGFFIELKENIWSRHLNCYDFEQKELYSLYDFNGYLSDFALAKDGKTAFISREGNIYRIDLKAKEDFYDKENHWQEIFAPELNDKAQKKENEQTSSPLEIDLKNIQERLMPIVKRTGYNEVLHVINDSTFYYLNTADDKYTLRKTDYKGENDEMIHTFAQRPEDITFNPENDAFYFLNNMQISKFNVNQKSSEIVSFEFKYSYNKKALNENIFLQAWKYFGKNFYDPEMHGKDWKKIKKRFLKYVEYIEDPQILDWIIEEMIGEVNASHTGFYPRRDEQHKYFYSAYLGCEFDYQDFPENGIRIKKVYNNSKLKNPNNIRADDILLSIDGINVEKGKKLRQLLRDKIGDEIKLFFKIKDGYKTVTIKGLSYRENYDLFYENWVEERRVKTEKLSKGKIGYVHIRRMNFSSYRKFYQELFTKNLDKEALIIDVRNNGGGYTHDLLIEILTRKPYALSSSRIFGAETYKTPSERIDKPMIVLINENSFSDAEIFPTLFQELKLGKVVGMPTSGSVIGTGHIRFMDGSGMRMPSHGWFTLQKENMEGSGVEPDILVEPTPKQIINDEDAQLQRAVEELLQNIK